MLDLISTDHNLRVLNKQSNVPLLADRGGDANMWDALKASGEKPYLIHRLDKGTSGVLLIARTQATQRTLTRLFAERVVSKYYLAIAVGEIPMGQSLQIDLPLCKGRKSRYRVAGERDHIRFQNNHFTIAQDREGVDARTAVRCLGHSGGNSLLLLKPVTGRTHQIRVHLSWVGYPLMGDHLYGRPSNPAQQASRLMLHCHRIVVPGWGRYTAPPPDFFYRF